MTSDVDVFGCPTSLIRVSSGTFVDLLDPQPGTIRIEDIAHSLSKLPRFNGHAPGRYSVDEHCLHCSTQAEREGQSIDAQLAALLHDAAEAYIGDITKPLKRLLAPILEPIERRLEEVIGEVLRVDLEEHRPAWSRIDRMLLVAERLRLFPQSPAWPGEDKIERLEVDFRFYDQVIARGMFLDRYDVLLYRRRVKPITIPR